MLPAAVFPQDDACCPETSGHALPAAGPAALLACPDAIAWRLPGTQEQLRARFLKKEPLRKNQKTNKNQCVDSNLCLCKVSSKTVGNRQNGHDFIAARSLDRAHTKGELGDVAKKSKPGSCKTRALKSRSRLSRPYVCTSTIAQVPQSVKPQTLRPSPGNEEVL